MQDGVEVFDSTAVVCVDEVASVPKRVKSFLGRRTVHHFKHKVWRRRLNRVTGKLPDARELVKKPCYVNIQI